jgi:hypothetical protein
MSISVLNVLKGCPTTLSAFLLVLVASSVQAAQQPTRQLILQETEAATKSQPAASVEPGTEVKQQEFQTSIGDSSRSQLTSSLNSQALDLGSHQLEQGTLAGNASQASIDSLDVRNLTLTEQQPPSLNKTASTLAQQVPSTGTAEVDSNDAILEQVDRYSDRDSSNPDNPETSNALDQVTNVSQLSDVSPGDWAYEALRNLVERYGCIAGYPDGTFRGNRAMTRYEFAAGLNACLQQVERLIQSSTGGFVTKQDLETLQRLVDEFRSELTAIGTRVDNLEGRVAFLEDHQFSTTTKLNAAVIFALAGITQGENALGEKVNRTAIFGDRIRLNFDTSFTGKDLLRVRLQALNPDSFSANTTLTPEGDLRFTAAPFETGDNNDVAVDALLYQFPIGEKLTVVIEGNAGAPDDFTDTVNRYIDGDGDSGALSNFGTRNPIYNLVGGTGLGLKYEFSENLELSLGYLAGDASNPEPGSGLFDGSYGALAQLTIKPTDAIAIGLTYINSYNNDFTAGSNRANLRSSPLLIGNPPISSNSYGLQASWQISPNFVVGGWAGYSNIRTLSTLDGTLERGSLDVFNFAGTLAFPDLGKKGSVAAIIVGMEPKVTSVSDSLKNTIGEDPDTSLHIEAFYQLQLTENIAITPGVIWLTAPDHNSNNEDVVIGAIRTTFTF